MQLLLLRGGGNDSDRSDDLAGGVWRSTEHYFQSRKYESRPDYQEKIMHAPTPRDAVELGRDRSIPMRADWESVGARQTTSRGDRAARCAHACVSCVCVCVCVVDDVQVKVSFMEKAQEAKFAQNADLMAVLQSTGQRTIVMYHPRDKFWGNGGTQ